jgi:hypothetical protein
LPGLVFGIVGGGICLFGLLLWPRKKVRSWRIGRAQSWLRAHIWLCLLSVPLIVLHSGFQWGGQLSTAVAVLFGLVIFSGVFGLVLQQFIPRLMLQRVPAETIYSQMDHAVEVMWSDAERLILAACGADPADEEERAPANRLVLQESTPYVTVEAIRTVGDVRGKVLQTRVTASPLAEREVLQEFFYTTAAPYLLQGRQSDSPLREAGRAARLFEDLRIRLGPAAAAPLAALENLCEQRRQLDLQSRLHGWLHGWLCVHVPLSVALVGLMFLHVYVALKYW